MSTVTADIPKAESAATAPTVPPPFGVNEMRLTPRQWLATLAIVAACWVLVPWAWKRFERFHPGPDYRIPYALSKDYWLYERRLECNLRPDQIPILGDSVVWGEYVRPDGTLSHFLNRLDAGHNDRFLNCGVNGMYPLALEGLVADYGRAIRGRKVIVQCNVLWWTSPKADLSAPAPGEINHSRLLPQLGSRVPPAYRAGADERLAAVIGRHVDFFAWTDHLENAYYDQRGLPQWTLEEDAADEPGYPNGWRNPLAPISAGIPGEPEHDPQRGPSSPRHRPWTAGGTEPTHFDWVSLDASLQWQAFRRVVALLRARGNDVFVILGPFNEHMIADDQRPAFRSMRDQVRDRLVQMGAGVIVPETLPSDLYADASHPLTAGYELLASRIWSDPLFQRWVALH